MNQETILHLQPLQSPWETLDPFLFCAYHLDHYPGGKDDLSPNARLEGRNIGQDFANKDGWNMYHGSHIPGFPAHPHRGFETVTIAEQGYADHSDSMGAIGRFGSGDVQWLTAGKGVQHAEMFPLLNSEKNTLQLFQIWLNLPQKSKMVAPYYKMLWHEDIPMVPISHLGGSVKLIAGEFNGALALEPTPDSWASDANNQVQIWIVRLAAHEKMNIPSSGAQINRALYFYEGAHFKINGVEVKSQNRVVLAATHEVEIENGNTPAQFLFLQGRPIGEPKAQYGPFVMNSHAEIQQALNDYQKTQFGGWPWKDSGPVLPKDQGRYAKYANGLEEFKDKK